VPDEVTLGIPATAAHLALARATASALAARLDFTYDRLTDLCIAIDEASGRVMATAETAPDRLELAFDSDDQGLLITIRGDRPPKPGAEFLSQWSKLILESVAGGLDVDEDDRGVTVRFTVDRGESR
jgi:anti-sigma regulatory factor (Ser/Thr protein kinase)